jgi:hypothetical protein
MPKPAHFTLTQRQADEKKQRFHLPTDVDEDSVLLPCLPTPIQEPIDPVDRHVAQVRFTTFVWPRHASRKQFARAKRVTRVARAPY